MRFKGHLQRCLWVGAAVLLLNAVASLRASFWPLSESHFEIDQTFRLAAIDERLDRPVDEEDNRQALRDLDEPVLTKGRHAAQNDRSDRQKRNQHDGAQKFSGSEQEKAELIYRRIVSRRCAQ